MRDVTVSAFELFKIGIGPSSSHTVGPMRAAKRFATALVEDGILLDVARVKAELFGSLGATGFGHGSPNAVMWGLEDAEPETIDTHTAPLRAEEIIDSQILLLANRHPVRFEPRTDLVLHRTKSLDFHPNGMTFRAWNEAGEQIAEHTYYSVGGGFVVADDGSGAPSVQLDPTPVPHPFRTGADLVEVCNSTGLSVAEVMWENETARRPREAVRAGLLRIWQVMRTCVEAGSRTEGVLPGGLKVRRRAADLHQRLIAAEEPGQLVDPLAAMDWVNLWALAVNEENAAGGRVVTAPTNGAAGIVPAVGHYLARFVPGTDDDAICDYLLVAAAIGAIHQQTGSISGAEVGCQGEVGTACSMAAAGMTAVKGGTVEQICNAAEIGLEHHLGLTCDPVGGLVQIPCIERNAVGSIKAINAAKLAMAGDGTHKVSLDQVIKTMMQTGKDMKVKYKETSRGGLAVNIVEC